MTNIAAPQKWFPIMAFSSYDGRSEADACRADGSPFMVVAVPWAMIALHEKQAQSNHGQSLQHLVDRGGLAPSEAMAILENRRWYPMPNPEAHRQLYNRVCNWEHGREDAAQRVIEAARAWWREEWGCEKNPEELSARRVDQGFPSISNEEVELMRALAAYDDAVQKDR